MEVLLRRTDARGCFKVHSIQASLQELLFRNILLTRGPDPYSCGICGEHLMRISISSRTNYQLKVLSHRICRKEVEMQIKMQIRLSAVIPASGPSSLYHSCLAFQISSKNQDTWLVATAFRRGLSGLLVAS